MTTENLNYDVTKSFSTALQMNNSTETNSLQTINILMVEDDDYYFRFVAGILSQPTSDVTFKLIPAKNLMAAKEWLVKDIPDVILLDLNLPDSLGLQTLMKVREVSRSTPIIILTASDDEVLGMHSVAHGAQDYLVKQRISADSLVRSIRYAITRRKAELAQLRLGAIKDFCAALAHDLQVPLVGSRNLLDTMLNEQNGAPPRREELVALRKSNGDQLALIQRLLEIYRYESQEAELKFEDICMDQMVSNCKENIFKKLHSNRCEIKTALQNNLRFRGDQEALERVLTSLLDNAIKFGNPGNTIFVSAISAGKTVVISVTSFGKVISPEDQSLLFQGFWQGIPGKKYVAYTGLGLYLCHHLVRLHGGKITCESSAEKGTTFAVTLPDSI